MKNAVLVLDRVVVGLALGSACVLLAVTVCLGFWQVLTRFVFELPSGWSEELVRRLLIWTVLLGTVAAFRQGALVSVDLMLRVARGRWRQVVHTVITAVNLVFLGVVAWYGTELAWRVRMQTFASMEISMAWAYAALPAGAVLGIVAVLAHHLDPRHDELSTAQ
ncbi:TRAP transporter small permease subunit [Bordetella petrii]|nr:TRAP transporter small permease subunit [Bordetella petrii]